MMKKLLPIFFLFFSCESLGEQTEYLDYESYVQEAWSAFSLSDYETSINLFNLAINQTNSSNFSDAYTGLGWAFMYKSNNLPGNFNQAERENLRENSSSYFEDAYDIDPTSGDILAGLTFLYNYDAEYQIYLYFNDNNYNVNNNNISNLLNKSLNISNSLIEDHNNYNFPYDDCIDLDNIRFLRSKMYLNLMNFNNNNSYLDLLINELNSINKFSCIDFTEFETISNLSEAIECINHISDFFNSCH
tara:strand:- start:4 stop:741 length:738 start_codon:yes stop_codon:yes gene_type:complete